MSNSAEQLTTLVQQFHDEHTKFEGGNKAAGTRARKHLMDIKKTADALRKHIQSTKNEG